MSKFTDIAEIFESFRHHTDDDGAAATLTLAYMLAPSSDERVTAEAAAAHFNVHPDTIRRALRGGNVPHLRVGRAVRVKLSDLEDYFATTDDKWASYAA